MVRILRWFWRGAAALHLLSCIGSAGSLSSFQSPFLCYRGEARGWEMVPRQTSLLTHTRACRAGHVGVWRGTDRVAADTGRVPRGPFAHFNRCPSFSVSSLWHHGRPSPSLNGMMFCWLFVLNQCATTILKPYFLQKKYGGFSNRR